MQQSPRQLFTNLIADFNNNRNSILSSRFYSSIRTSYCPVKGAMRYSGSYHSYAVTGFDQHFMINWLRIGLRKFESFQQIVNWVISNNYWIKPVESYEVDLRTDPSISGNIVAGFIVRNFEINNYTFEITDPSFNQAFDELMLFLEKDSFEITILQSLHGPSGDLEEIELGENSSIVKVDHRIAELFNRYYSTTDGHYIDMFDGDYILKTRYSALKKDYFKSGRLEKQLLEKLFMVALLAGIGNIEKGKIIYESSDWPLNTIHAPHSFYYNINRYDFHHPSVYSFTTEGIPLIQRAIDIIGATDVSKLDQKIQHAIKRVIKAKAATSIDDKVVELALALEYIINTERYEITLQLRLKGTRVYASTGEEELSYNTIRDFYDLRSKVVHGNASIEDTPKTQTTMKNAEKIILVIILRFIELNQKYSYDQISKALARSLYICGTLEEILEKKMTD
jgi:hypothetical protein